MVVTDGTTTNNSSTAIADGKSVAERLRDLLEWARQNRLKVAIAGTMLLVLVGGLTALGIYFADQNKRLDVQKTLDEAMTSLKNGGYQHAASLSAKLQQQGDVADEDLGQLAFVRGAAAAYEAEGSWSADVRQRQYLIASKYLEEARDRGFPEGHEGEGLWLLGKCLVFIGQFSQSRPVLLNALKVGAKEKQEIHHLLSKAFYHDAFPNNQLALKYIDLYLTDQLMPANERFQAWLERSQIQFRLGQLDESKKTLAKIPTNSRISSEAMVMHGRYLIHEAQLLAKTSDAKSPEIRKEINAIYDKAISFLAEARARDKRVNQSTPKAMYLIGVSLEGKQDDRAAIDQYTRTHKLYIATPEGLASMLGKAELLRKLEEDEEAIKSYLIVLKLAGKPIDYSNPWISLKLLRERILATYEAYMKSKKFAHVIRLAAKLYPIFSRTHMYEFSAQAHRTWAEDNLAKAKNMPLREKQKLTTLGRAQMRAAGKQFSKLAKIRIATSHYSQDLWLSADSFVKGHAFSKAITQLKKYLINERRVQRPLALVGLGESYLAIGRNDDALKELNECIEFHPRHVASYRARLLAGKAYVAKSQPDDAEKLFKANLFESELTPDSPEWKKSLFALGKLTYSEGDRLEAESQVLFGKGESKKAEALKKLERSHAYYRSATKHLAAAVGHYPNDAKTIEAKYLLAESYRQSASLHRYKLQDEKSDQKRQTINERIHRTLAQSLEQFDDLKKQLHQRQETGRLTDVEQSILRFTYFAIAGVRYESGQYFQAIQEYEAATDQYQNSPEALNGLFQIAACYRRLNQNAEARGTLEKAKVVLARMTSKDEVFVERTGYTRAEWVQLLDWMAVIR